MRSGGVAPRGVAWRALVRRGADSSRPVPYGPRGGAACTGACLRVLFSVKPLVYQRRREEKEEEGAAEAALVGPHGERESFYEFVETSPRMLLTSFETR